jgi:hypothetical protein
VAHASALPLTCGSFADAMSETRSPSRRMIRTVRCMGTTATSTTYRLSPLDSDSAAALRDLGGLTYVADEKPGYPCRHCLRDAEIGEALVLVSHDPFDPEVDTPYRSASPIFLHADPCNAPGDLADLPEQLTVRQLSVRAFDRGSMMIDAAAIDGRELDAELHRLFDDPAIQEIHVHNSPRGCWATSVVR